MSTKQPQNFDQDSDSYSQKESGSNESLKHVRNRKSKKIACTECRQQKAKCDAFEKNPDPCTRCSKRKIECRLDGDFKRTFKRAKIDELVKEYEIIKSKLQSNAPNLILSKSQANSPIHFRYSPSSDGSSVNNSNNNSNNNNNNNNNNSYNSLQPQQHYSPLQNFQRNNNMNPTTNMFSVGNSGIPSPIAHPIQQIHHDYSSQRYAAKSPIPIKSNSPVNSQSKPYSPLNFQYRANSPLSSEVNDHNNNGSATSTNQIPPTSNGFNQQNQPQSIPLQSQISQSGSNFNLTTLISAASANPPLTTASSKTSQKLEPSVQPIINNNYSNWIIKTQSVEKPKVSISSLECTSKSIGEVNLSEEQIIILFTTYVTYYHPLLPVIDVNKGIEKIYKLCPILFWTVMLTALRGQHTLLPVITPEESQSLYFALSPIIKSVLAEITISPITRYVPSENEEPILNASSVYSVQSLLIYTFWPPVTSSLSADSSWNTVGIAMYQAIRIGLHSPGHTADGIKNKELVNEQIRTWIACNVVSQTIATVFGYPGFVEPYASLLVMCSNENGITIPKSLKQMLEVQIFEEQVTKTLNSNIFDPLKLNQASDKLPMIQLLDEELNQLELRLCSDRENPMDDFRKLSLYAARLHLLSYNFLDTDLVANFELRRGFVKTYNSALAIIQHIKESHDRDADFVSRLPTAYILTVWQASVIIARLVNSCYKPILDVGTGKELYQIAISLVMKASVMKHDLAYRSCGIMKSTWNLFRAIDEAESGLLKVTVRSRMSASVFFDSLWTLREKCGMIKLRPSDKKTSISESIEYDSEEENEENKKGDNIVIGNKNTQAIIDVQNESRSQSRDSTASKRKLTYHQDSAARKIISTIPLDPQPIALAETPLESSSSSKQGSPYLANYKSPTNNDSHVKKIITPQSLANASANFSNSATRPSPSQNIQPPDNNANNSINSIINNKDQPMNDSMMHMSSSDGLKNINSIGSMIDLNNASNNNEAVNNSDNLLLDSWIIGDSFDSGMLFKDLDSVMNEFGFHADY